MGPKVISGPNKRLSPEEIARILWALAEPKK